MTYGCNEKVSAIALADRRESAGWNRMESEYESPVMTPSSHIAAYENHGMAGYIDCVSDGVTDANIQDLTVHPAYQGRDFGTELMHKMISHLKDKRIYMISVVYEEDLKPFYERFGFSNMLCGQIESYRG